jgi:hypothetical protein
VVRGAPCEQQQPLEAVRLTAIFNKQFKIMKILDVYLVKLGSGYTYINNVPLSKFSLEWILTKF